MNQRQAETFRGSLGSTFMKRLTEVPVITVGGEPFSRDRLVREVGVGNFAAAKRLSDQLDALNVKTAKDVKMLHIEDLAAEKGVGETQIYVLMCLQDHLFKVMPEWEGTWRTYAKHNRNGKKNGKAKK